MDDTTLPVALVTGAASGIGLATARELHHRGHRVLLADIDHAAATERARDLDPESTTAHAVAVDIADSGAIAAMIEAGLEHFGRLDTVVNNAGLPGRHTSAEMTDAEWDRLLTLNLSGTFTCCRAAYPALAASDFPSVVNVSSLYGLVGVTGRAGYSAAKAGLLGLTRSLAAEWAPDGIRVNAVAPGYVRTHGFEQRMKEPGRDMLRKVAEGIPLKRMAAPEDIANAIAFMASRDAAYITGQVLPVDGGVGVVHAGGA